MSFDWSVYTGNLEWLLTNTLFLTKHGSHAYGTSLPTSDLDLRGICIPPRQYYFGFGSFEQACQTEPDLTVFELRKFMRLAADCNPNAIEILFTDPSDHLVVSPQLKILLEHRDDFLSTKALHTFSGYAASQLHRINLHYKWLKDPPKAPPTRSEFGLTDPPEIPKNQMEAAMAQIKKKLSHWNWHELDNLDDAQRICVQDEFTRILAEITQWGWQEKEDQLWRSAANSLGFETNFLQVLDCERRYNAKLNNWKNYQTWLKSRNPARAELEAKSGYDCYLDDTEFLTLDGWKKYDDIKDDAKLATLNQETHEIEWQVATERISKEYDGPIVFCETQDSACAVTPNHRMWASEVKGGKNNKDGCGYNPAKANWKINSIEKMMAGRRYSYHIRTAVNSQSVPSVDDHLLMIVGCYVSEGTIASVLKNGNVSSISFSQKECGRQEPFLERLFTERLDVRKYSYPRNEPNRKTPIIENKYNLSNRELVDSVVKDCGIGSDQVHLPSWAFQLNQKDARFLLDVMISGDGTERKYSRIYYTTSKQLADDTQILAVTAGFVSKVWGPYQYDKERLPSYQVYIGEDCFSRLIVKGKKSQAQMENRKGRIVCFTVPNEILITRRKGKVAIQGNTKHASHLVRLMRMCREILTTGQVLVRRPDAEELLSIRNGAWTYEQLIAWSEKQDEELKEVAKTSKLPWSANRVKLEKIMVEMIWEFIK